MVPEATRHADRCRFTGIDIPGRSSIFCFIEYDGAEETVYVGLAFPVEPLLGSVQLPDGAPLPVDRAWVSISSRARRHTGGDAFAVARKSIIWVSIDLDGYDLLQFKWTLGDPLPPRSLVRD